MIGEQPTPRRADGSAGSERTSSKRVREEEEMMERKR